MNAALYDQKKSCNDLYNLAFGNTRLPSKKMTLSQRDSESFTHYHLYEWHPHFSDATFLLKKRKAVCSPHPTVMALGQI